MGGDPDRKPRRGRRRFASSQANHVQLKAFRDLCKKLGLDDDEQEEFHNAITGKGLDYAGMKAVGEDMFPDGGSLRQ
jgi:hypothetical protein